MGCKTRGQVLHCALDRDEPTFDGWLREKALRPWLYQSALTAANHLGYFGLS